MNPSSNTRTHEGMTDEQLLHMLTGHADTRQTQPAQPAQPRSAQHNSVEHDLGIWSLHYHLEMKPQDIQSRYELARRYTCYRAYRQAVREYLKLLCLEPYYYAARLELADCYTRLEMWQEAARELRLLTMVSGYAQDAWQRLAALDQQMPRPFTQHEADAQQHVWEMLHK